MSDDELLLVSILAPEATVLITQPAVQFSQLVEVEFVNNIGAIRPLISHDSKDYGVIVDSKIILNANRGTNLVPALYYLRAFAGNDTFVHQMKPRTIFKFVADKLVFDSDYRMMCMKDNEIINLGEGFETI